MVRVEGWVVSGDLMEKIEPQETKSEFKKTACNQRVFPKSVCRDGDWIAKTLFRVSLIPVCDIIEWNIFCRIKWEIILERMKWKWEKKDLERKH